MKTKCNKLYEWLNRLERYSFPFDKNQIPNNGIYILFEKGEIYKQYDRVVRVGSHTGFNKLPSRLIEHFIKENKDRSIFRKNIGRAILNKENDKFLELWEIDLTSKDARDKLEHRINIEQKNNVEKRVTNIIQKNFSFVVFEIENKDERIYYEKKLISTFSLCPDSFPSKDWLGNYSPKRKIKESGLWQVNEIWKTALNDYEMDELKSIFK